jgi:hypothetical protein
MPKLLPDTMPLTEFPRLWLTDSGLLRELAHGHVLLASHFNLYDAALRRGFKALNFNELRATSFR